MPGEMTSAKQTGIDWIHDHRNDLIGLSDEIWGYAEPGLREYDSAAALCDYLTRNGFAVEQDLAGMPTAFTATHGTGTPRIGLFAEYDATPGDSQRPVPYKDPVHPDGAGYMDMHNGLGVGSVGAACALAHTLADHALPGTITLFGTPAEKLTTGKPYLARDGHFDPLDAVVAWHPRPYTTVEKGHGPSPCREFILEFEGEAFYSAKPWHGQNALDATTLFRTMVNTIKNRFDPRSYASVSDIVAHGGSHPTSLPGFTQSWITTRAVDLDTLDRLETLLTRCCDAASLVTGCDGHLRVISAVRPWLPNTTMADTAYANLELVGPPTFTSEDKAFANEIIQNLDEPPLEEPFDETLTDPDHDPTSDFLGGADDVNEFCWHAPTCRIYVSYMFRNHYDHGYPSWAAAALAKTNVAHTALTTAAKAMAATSLDLIQDDDLLATTTDEFERRTADTHHPPLLDADATPPIDESIPPFYPPDWEPPYNIG